MQSVPVADGLERVQQYKAYRAPNTIAQEKAGYRGAFAPENDGLQTRFDSAGLEVADSNGKNGRICGVKRKVFWIVLAVVIGLVIGAAVGGGVGGALGSKKTRLVLVMY